jgi:hypothetical protein
LLFKNEIFYYIIAEYQDFPNLSEP